MAEQERSGSFSPRDVDVLVVGAGQAGLGTAYWLHRAARGVRLLVVDASSVGQSWLERWDSLTLFTPRRFSSLPGLHFPDGPGRTPSRTEMAAYLQTYAQHLDLPVETGVRVQRLTPQRCGFVAWTSTGPIHAAHVVIATGPFHRPNIPAAGRDLDPAVTQLHSYHYRSPADIPCGPVLVVGGGNSAAQLALELAKTHPVTIASPGPPWFLPEDVAGVSMYWWMLLTGVLNAASGAQVSKYIRRRGDAIVGRQLRQLIRGGHVHLRPHRVVSAEGRQVGLADGSSLTTSSVLWCTGYRPDTSWIQIAGVTDSAGAPLHHNGASPMPGLHWMGLPWQTRLNSSIIDGVDRDARRTARRILRADERRSD